jgi:RNA polymerase II subunit A small phosphatase-like protein
MEPGGPILLILDLDETLVYATEEPLPRSPDFHVGPYAVYRRPYLAEFLTSCSACFRLAIWSTATDEFVRPVVARIMPPAVEPAFVWGRSRCVRRYDPEQFEEYHAKDLKKVRRMGYRLERVLIADDTPRKVVRHYGNAVYVPPFFGDLADETLPRLARFLIAMRDAPTCGLWRRGAGRGGSARAVNGGVADVFRLRDRAGASNPP